MAGVNHSQDEQLVEEAAERLAEIMLLQILNDAGVNHISKNEAEKPNLKLTHAATENVK